MVDVVAALLLVAVVEEFVVVAVFAAPPPPVDDAVGVDMILFFWLISALVTVVCGYAPAGNQANNGKLVTIRKSRRTTVQCIPG